MIHPLGNVRTQLSRWSGALSIALALGACAARPGTDGSEPAAGQESGDAIAVAHTSRNASSRLAKHLTPAGLATATLDLFKKDELDPAQQEKLAALREEVVNAENAMRVDILSQRDAARLAGNARDFKGVGASMTESQRVLLDGALVGAFELRGTLSPAQRTAFLHRTKKSAAAARQHAAKLAAGAKRNAEQDALAQARIIVLEALANPALDESSVRTLGSAFVDAHARVASASLVASMHATKTP